MKTAVTETSINCFYSHEYKTQRERVLGAIWFLREACIADVAALLDMQTGTVAARRNELQKDGKIEYVGKRQSKTTGIQSDHWKVKETLF